MEIVPVCGSGEGKRASLFFFCLLGSIEVAEDEVGVVGRQGRTGVAGRTDRLQTQTDG